MKLKSVETASGAWFIHTEINDMHIAKLRYEGGLTWDLKVEKPDGIHLQEFTFTADHIEDALQRAFKIIETSEVGVQLNALKPEEIERASQPVSPVAVLMQEMLHSTFRIMVQQPEGLSEYMHMLSAGLGNAIAIGAREHEPCIEIACGIMRETINRQLKMTQMAQEFKNKVTGDLAEFVKEFNAASEEPDDSPPRH